MELDKFLIGIIVFTVIIVSGVLIIADMNNNYEGVMEENISTDEFSDVYDTTDEIYNMSQNIKTSIIGKDVEEGGTEDSMFLGTYQALRFLSKSFKITGDILNSVASVLGIPRFLIVLALAAITIAVIFGIIMIILRIARG